MQSGRAEISPSTTLSDNGPASAVGAGAQGKKKFAHFRRLFSSLHKKNHNRDGSGDAHNLTSGKHNYHSTSSGASSKNNSLSSLHLPHFHQHHNNSGFIKHHHDDDPGHDGSSVKQRLRVPPTSSTVILRRPSTASSGSTASDENAPVISDRYKGYILETYGTPVRTIGQGTGGYVKLHQACDGRYYAVKTFTFPDANDRTRMTSTRMNVRQWKHLLDEASFSLSLRHPNVIRTYQFVREDDGTVYSIMEYCEKDLFTVVQEGSLTPEDIDRLFFQLMSGIAYLHDSARVAHRDMKLDNLCVDEEGNLKIIDFGCSSTFDPMAPAQTRGICGSDPYIAPEVFVPRAQYDPRKVDIWALGIIYLAMVSGHFPWEVAKAQDPNYSLYLKYHGRVIDHWLPKTKPANAVIKSMLEIDPTDRPTIDAVMKDPWVAGLHERYGHSSTTAVSGMTLSKTSTLASSPVDIKAVNEAMATSCIYGNTNVRYSSTSTVSSGLSISSGY
ncbi:serine/threonine protein kinase [Coemansia sp. RSA 1813]|nr:serine/threonine protein kinase [Coemansia sp. RSA 1646]KAJ1770589.1 serine/threonine protein kinase [Coemansia sp. RSA 1843]KAJ2091412.1 serine/threonine protein kinase [Coemansia sp. RSA 986]KAJ2212831.1 serine/threonine protein kinase [Coemansia sp. RSA 487]KAJ2569575.1 serine/threonine protein kinase [Coemansia sp. RSA 1813]